MLDSGFVRAQFPAFSEPTLSGFVHADNAGGSWACARVIDRLTAFYTRTKLQPGGPSAPSFAAAECMESARRRMSGWLNAGAEEVHFGPSTSQNTYVLAQALRGYLAPGDEIIVTNLDHEANIGAWRRLANDGLVVREWSVDPDTAELDTRGLERLLNERTRAVAFTHASNIVGSINPVRAWCDLVRQAGAMSIVDGVSFAPHGVPDVRELGADAYLFSLYKVYGPHLGVLYLDREWNARLPNQGHFFNAGSPGARLTPAGPDHAQVAAVNGVIDYFEALDRHHGGAPGDTPAARVRALMAQREAQLAEPLVAFLAGRAGVRLIGRDAMRGRAPTVSFTVAGMRPERLARGLAERGVGVGYGHFYAHRLIEALGIDPDLGVVRCSLVHYNTPEEVGRLLDALDTLL